MRNRSGFLNIVIGIAVLAVLIGGGYWYWQNQNYSDIAPIPTLTPVITYISTVIPDNRSLSDTTWKEYVSDEKGYVLGLPEGWYERGKLETDAYFSYTFSYNKEPNPDDFLSLDILSVAIFDDIKTLLVGSNYWNSVSEYFNALKKIQQDLETEFASSLTVSSVTVKKIDEYSGPDGDYILVAETPSKNSPTERFTETHLYLLKNNILYSVTISIQPSSPRYSEALEIAKTFRLRSN